MEIRVEHLTRVEGHGNILASVEEGGVGRALFEVVEANRFFEGFVRGRHYEEVVHIAPRICGICALSHSSVAVHATEKALGVEVSEQTEVLRRLIMAAEVISSHALHVCFLAAPDFLGVESVMPLMQEDPDTVRRAFRLKKGGYELGELVAGRHPHPVSVTTGGFTSLPKPAEFEEMRDRLVSLRDDIEATVELFKSVEIPQFERPTEYVCLRQPDHYAFYEGEIVSSEGEAIPVDDYEEVLREYVVAHSTAKHVRWHRDSYMVGALARVNNNWGQLVPEAQDAMKELGLAPPCHNPFMNTVAQVVELVHCLEESVGLIEELLARGLTEEEMPRIEPAAGRGIGAVEAPRGLLIHDYAYDAAGRCTKANCVIPTNQNFANLDLDMQALLPQLAGASKDEVQRHLEMLVRAYDPCISCSVH